MLHHRCLPGSQIRLFSCTNFYMNLRTNGFIDFIVNINPLYQLGYIRPVMVSLAVSTFVEDLSSFKAYK